MTVPLWNAVRTLWLRLNQRRRQRRWNRQYAAGGWTWLGRLGELARYHVLSGYALELKPGGVLLDVGCGEGLFRDRLHPGAFSRYVGIDFEEPVRQAAARADERTFFVAADMNFFQPDIAFDTIVFNETLYTFRDVEGGLRRYEAFLAPRGVFLVSMVVTEKSRQIWATLDALYTVIDEVTVTNGKGTSWICKALGVPTGESATTPAP